MLKLKTLRQAYATGAFPMAASEAPDANIDWFRPDIRGVILPRHFHVPKRLARLLRQKPFTVKWNDDFRGVMQACGAQRPHSWINAALLDAYTAWHEAGEAFCLSVFQDGVRVGGIYGVQRGGVFMAESMFSRVDNASSVALVLLVAGLAQAGIELIDVQYPNAHTEKFNIISLQAADYQTALDVLRFKPVGLKADYFCFDAAVSFVQSLSQTS